MSDRWKQLFRVRSKMGWNVAKVAAMLDVTPRTVSLWEAGEGDPVMPDARWRHFILEVADEVRRNSELVVVIDENGQACDVVSDANFVDIVLSEDQANAVIASYAIDRNNVAYVHRQPFRVAYNQHVLVAAMKWDLDRHSRADTTDEALLTANRWLTRRALEAEANNPLLIKLKADIRDAKAALDAADNEPEEMRRARQDDLDTAIFALIAEIERMPKPRAA